MSDTEPATDGGSISRRTSTSGPDPRESKTWTRLVEDGPTALHTGFSGVSVSIAARREGVSKFNVTSTSGDSLSGTGPLKTVYYIRGRHDPREVVGAWIDENTDRIGGVTPWAIHQRISRNHGDEFVDASRDLLGPFDGITNCGGANHETDVESCGVCGKPLGDKEFLSTHLSECPGERVAEYADKRAEDTDKADETDTREHGTSEDDYCPICHTEIGDTPLPVHLPKCPKRGDVGSGERL